jgi:inward rectifier potassium channel
VRIGDREVISRGIDTVAWTDLYHRSMGVGWAGFFGSAAFVFACFNLVFATLYWIGDHPIANARPGHFIDLMFFSIETLATVGYGDMHPQTIYGHSVATIEIFTGMCSIAVMTGLIFARFSRPRARIIFARHPIICQLDGKPALMIRLANARHNYIADANAKLWLVLMERTQEGQQLRRSYPLTLLRNETPMFVLSWSLAHRIDANSPLYGKTDAMLEQAEAMIILIIAGLDEGSGQDMHARHLYTHTDIRRNYQYVDIISNQADGSTLVDYEKFHDVVPE